MARRIKTTSTAKKPVGAARRGRPPGSKLTEPASAPRVVKIRLAAPGDVGLDLGTAIALGFRAWCCGIGMG